MAKLGKYISHATTLSTVFNNIVDEVNSLSTKSGTTSNRPTGIEVGSCYFDSTIGKPIWWNGSKWIDAVGADV